jgi:hypothetical protein
MNGCFSESYAGWDGYFIQMITIRELRVGGDGGSRGAVRLLVVSGSHERPG